MSKVQIAPHLQGRQGAELKDPWWLTPKRQRAGAVKMTVDHWVRQHDRRLKEYGDIMQQYSSAPVGIDPGDYESAGHHSEYLRYNLFRSAVDTIVARYAKERPRAIINTEKGRYRHRQHAKKLQKLVDGVFRVSKLYPRHVQSMKDAVAFGLGFLKVVPHPQTLDMVVDRVHPGEVVWDIVDAFRGEPHEMAHRVVVPRRVVMALFPGHRKAIGEADMARASRLSTNSLADVVHLDEVWKLPSYYGAGDGRRALVCGDALLQDEEWPFDFFPLVPIHYTESFRGFSGESLASLLLGLQGSINSDLLSAEDAVRRASILTAWVSEKSGASIQQLENDPEQGRMVEYSGEKPVFEVPQVLSADATEFTQRKIGYGFEVAGVSQLSASGQKPAGLDAGVALREQQDIESVRFMPLQRAGEDAVMGVAERVLAYAHTYWKGKAKKVKSPGRGFIETINFDDIDLSRDMYEISVQPASMLPVTPAGRLQMVSELMQMQFLSQAQALSLLDLSDLEAETSLKTAAQDDIDATMDAMLFDDPAPEELQEPEVASALASARRIQDPVTRAEEEARVIARVMYTPPEADQVDADSVARVQAILRKERHSNVPEARLNLVREWLVEAQELMQAAAMAGQANAVGVGPSGTPGPMGAPMGPEGQTAPGAPIEGLA